MKKNRKAFSLLEVLIGVLLLSIICLFLFPSLFTNLDASYKTKDAANTTFILQEAIETNRDKEIGSYSQTINGKDIEITIKRYENPAIKPNTYKKIRAAFGDRALELIVVDKSDKENIEVDNEEEGL